MKPGPRSRNRFTASLDRLIEENPIVVTRVRGSEEHCEACGDDRPLPHTRIVFRIAGSSCVVCRGCRARLVHLLQEDQ